MRLGETKTDVARRRKALYKLYVLHRSRWRVRSVRRGTQAVTRILADLMHLCDGRKIDFSIALRDAGEQYRKEKWLTKEIE